MSPPKHTKFCDCEFQSWLARDGKGDRSAKCKLCMSTIKSNKMGRHALTSHLKSKKKKKTRVFPERKIKIIWVVY